MSLGAVYIPFHLSSVGFSRRRVFTNRAVARLRAEGASGFVPPSRFIRVVEVGRVRVAARVP